MSGGRALLLLEVNETVDFHHHPSSALVTVGLARISGNVSAFHAAPLNHIITHDEVIS